MKTQMNSGIPHGKAITRLTIGFFILFSGIVGLLHEAGLVQETGWLWPFALIYFGLLIIIGAAYRLLR